MSGRPSDQSELPGEVGSADGPGGRHGHDLNLGLGPVASIGIPVLAVVAGLALVVAGLVTAPRGAPSAVPADPITTGPPRAGPSAGPSAPNGSDAPTGAPLPAESPIPAAPAPADLPVIDYGPPPTGFPPDPAPLDAARLTEGLHPAALVAAYDAPGGRPRAFLAPTLSDVPLVMPIVARRANWVAVLLPSVNRRVGWVPDGGWRALPLRDQLLVERRTHRLTWLRDGHPVDSWPVTLGLPSTPTPLGRTFILGRSTLPGEVYGDTDVFALGAVPDDPDAVPAGLRGAHIGLHTWHHDGELGRNTTDGCIRVTRSAQRRLLAELAPGTPLVVVDRLPGPREASPPEPTGEASPPEPTR